MELYTSYYANLKNIPMDYAAIGISTVCPDWLIGDKSPSNFYFFEDGPFAPSKDILAQYKKGEISDTDYTYFYFKRLNQIFNFKNDGGKGLSSYLEDLKRRFFDYIAIVFLCYETPEEFCHRHMLADLLIYYGIPISEMDVPKKVNKLNSEITKKSSSNALF